jgi:hypothetical protein
MCPDKQLLSVYYDDELPSPWKEKMETHLVLCTDCRTTVSGYGKLSSLLNLSVAQEVPSVAAYARMREKLLSAENRNAPSRMRIFARRVVVPLPLAVAAAAALVFAFAALLAQGRTVRPIPETVAEGIHLEPEEIRRVSSMDDALRFIENDEFFAGSQSVIMRLPKNKTFNNFGNPQIQNVAGGSPRGSGRR